MTDGLNLDGFTANRKEAGTNDINASGAYSPATGSFPAAADKSSQGPAGVTNKMVHTAAETSAFGTGN
jgi:hypothetical protein